MRLRVVNALLDTTYWADFNSNLGMDISPHTVSALPGMTTRNLATDTTSIKPLVEI